MPPPERKQRSRQRSGDKESKPQIPVLVPREDGRGALNSGGTPGNKGGGRLPSELRSRLRDLADLGMPRLNEILLGKVETESSTRAMDVCLKYGLGEQLDLRISGIDPELIGQAISSVCREFNIADDVAVEMAGKVVDFIVARLSATKPVETA